MAVWKLQPKVGLGGYDILFAYFVVEAKSKKSLKNTTKLGDVTVTSGMSIYQNVCIN